MLRYINNSGGSPFGAG